MDTADCRTQVNRFILSTAQRGRILYRIVVVDVLPCHHIISRVSRKRNMRTDTCPRNKEILSYQNGIKMIFDMEKKCLCH